MLQHEHSEADKARVTAAELASAIAALQARRDASGDTLALGEAVRDLALDASPQEILAEVEAQRARQNGNGRSTRRRMWRAATVAVIALSTFGEDSRPSPPRAHTIGPGNRGGLAPGDSPCSWEMIAQP